MLTTAFSLQFDIVDDISVDDGITKDSEWYIKYVISAKILIMPAIIHSTKNSHVHGCQFFSVKEKLQW